MIKLEHKVKVLLFVDRMRHGGIQQFIIENIKHMDKSNLSIDVLTLDDGQTYPLEETVQAVGANFYKLKNIWIHSPIDYIKYAKAINVFFKEHNDYKVIHMNASSKNFILLKYAKKYEIPIRIAHSHNIDFQSKNILKKYIGNFFKISLKRYATDYFACSKLAGEWLFGKKNVDRNNVKVIHNAVDYHKFQFDECIRKKIRNEFSIPEDVMVIGNVGRFTTQKNHTFLIDIFYEIQLRKKDSILILVGIGELEDRIRDKVKRLGLESKVIFTGFRNDVNEIMQAMDLFLLPSLYEGLPVVGVEAQAIGIPVFTSKDVVTEEAKVSQVLHFISLKETAQEWAHKILQSDLHRCDTAKELKSAGYFIEDSAQELSNFYMK